MGWESSAFIKSYFINFWICLIPSMFAQQFELAVDDHLGVISYPSFLVIYAAAARRVGSWELFGTSLCLRITSSPATIRTDHFACSTSQVTSTRSARMTSSSLAGIIAPPITTSW